VQNPWVIRNPDGASPNEELILKEECYVFDFAPDRALRQIADYSCRLNVNEDDPEKKVEEFIRFLPVLAYDGSSMKQIDAAGVLDMAMSGTTATLLARRWESALLVNVDNDTLRRLMDNEQAMQALMRIEGFRNLNQEIETIINKSEAVKKAKKEANDRELSPSEKKTTDGRGEGIQEPQEEDSRETDQVRYADPRLYVSDGLSRKNSQGRDHAIGTGLVQKGNRLTVKDFELLVSLGVFNSALMNDAVYKFKRYEDPSLVYTGINRHDRGRQRIGGNFKMDFIRLDQDTEGTVINCRKDFDLHNNKVIAQVYDSINNINSPNFFLWVRIEGTISSAPSVRKERIKIERWLENLDPDNYYGLQKSADIYELPIYKWEFQGSIIQLIAVAKPPCLRGKQGIRPIEAYLPEGVKQIDNAPMIKRSISDKAGRYGVFNIPYIIATNILGIFPDHTDVVDALFGQEAVKIRNSEGVDEEVLGRCQNGVFIGPKGPQNTRVSAVLVFFDLNPFNLASNQPVLYHNPWASKPLLLNELPFDQVVYTSNFNQIPAKISLGNLLDLPTPWPIPDDRDST
jgi:hypothetical protein